LRRQDEFFRVEKTSYLLAGENTGSKYQKALTLGTPIITEAEFLDMIQE
ncbi:hypothetical protein OBE_05279, partial [human gut metagenome]